LIIPYSVAWEWDAAPVMDDKRLFNYNADRLADEFAGNEITIYLFFQLCIHSHLILFNVSNSNGSIASRFLQT
jgi:hypothetical protein